MKLSGLARCQRCTRLAEYLQQTAEEQPDYYCKPVPAFGDASPDLLIIGLAPGKHGANATGRPFTGDYAGKLLYETLFEFGYSTAPESRHRRDGLELKGCRITNAVKCLPPENKPTAAEVNTCNEYLSQEISALPPHSVILALGLISHKAVLKATGCRQKDFKFAHAARHQLSNDRILYDSYHCSRYNTQTGRLTTDMFRAVFRKIRAGD